MTFDVWFVKMEGGEAKMVACRGYGTTVMGITAVASPSEETVSWVVPAARRLSWART